MRYRSSYGQVGVWTHGGVGRLYSVLVRDGGVHVNQAQKVKAQRRGQTTKEPESEKTKRRIPDITTHDVGRPH